jgi:hypothetical protein
MRARGGCDQLVVWSPFHGQLWRETEHARRDHHLRHKAVTAGDRVALSPDPKHATSRCKNAKRSTYELEPSALQDVASRAPLETGIS